MSDEIGTPVVDHDALAHYLAAIAYPARLRLLEQLRFPRTLGEIRLAPARGVAASAPERPAARQTVQKHLRKLEEAGFVDVGEVEQRGRSVSRYSANAVALYALLEELKLVIVRQAAGPAAGETATVAGGPAAAPVSAEPTLVVVNGVVEGKAFRLTPEAAGDAGEWVIGRSRHAAVALDYDPFASLENAAVTATATGHAVRDLGSKNGTRLNWRTVGPGVDHALRPGDVIGVGRSLLVYRP